MTARDRILSRIPASEPVISPPAGVYGPPETSDLLAQFEERFLFHSGEIWTRDALNSWSEGQVLIEAGLPEGIGPHFCPTTDDPWEATLGVTGCHLLIAETGTIAIAAQAGQRRLASLCPETHVVVASRTQIVSNLDRAIALLGSATTVWITGPSRTADIEGILVRGIHGPKRLALVWTD